MSATQAVNISSTVRPARAVSLRALTYISIVTADVCAFSLSWVASAIVRHEVAGRFGPIADLNYLPALVLCACVFLLAGLYPGIALNPIEEFRRILRAASLGFLLSIGMTFYLREGLKVSGAVFLLGWVFTLALTFLGRNIVRSWCSRQTWWGIPTVILGDETSSEVTLNLLSLHPPLGLRPVAVLSEKFDLNPASTEHDAFRKHIFSGDLSHAARIARDYPGCYAIMSMPLNNSSALMSILTDHTTHFRRVLVIPELFGLTSLSVTAKDICGVLALEVDQHLTRFFPQVIKRAFDLAICVSVGAIMSLPILAIFILTRLSSAGPAFYGHSRIGRGGQRFKVWKFRTMVQNADSVLEEHLERDPALRAEWDRDQKLRRDPRVTKLGRFLRKTSLDEIPQLWNVIRGEMSLVGPRPIVNSEVDKYGINFRQYCRVTPGITGLWQISGRNNTTYELRTQLDNYYVRNWSVTVDLYILLRTLKTVLLTEGAY